VHSFTVTFRSAGGGYYLKVADATAAGIASLSVAPGPASSFNLVSFPSTTPAAAAQTFFAMAFDAYNNLATGYTGTVQFTSSDNGASLPADYPFTAADAGVHTFSVTLNAAAAFQTLQVSDPATAGLMGRSEPAVAAAAPSRLVVTGIPGSVQEGS